MPKIAFFLLLVSLMGCSSISRKNYDTVNVKELNIHINKNRNQVAYCGSDSGDHYFAKWKHGAMLFHFGPSSYLHFYRVPKSEIPLKRPFLFSSNQEKWATYNLGDKLGAVRFNSDFSPFLLFQHEL